ncbi:putative helix-turn-helix HTH_28 domain containing protein 3 [Homarus americanus]|uniref:Putative helix-turn-helix HTH_28 domain containing protein 3 n=1 Tax=Homarus americanus TaxID=6706 RepID=A0A8J5KDP4_HOMAM|nr:putative helix-turn-helix HTH_28 domain containing protein 3 [Homarus americanus]
MTDLTSCVGRPAVSVRKRVLKGCEFSILSTYQFNRTANHPPSNSSCIITPVTVMEVQPQRHVRPPRTRANRPEVITSRGRIIEYHEAGEGIREISRLLGISRDTVRLWVRRHEEEGHELTRPRPG